jgi:hypothetical protein
MQGEVIVKRIDVVKKGNQWVAEANKQVVAKAPTKGGAVKKTAAVAEADPNAVTMKMHKMDGKIQEEKTTLGQPQAQAGRAPPGTKGAAGAGVSDSRKALFC